MSDGSNRRERGITRFGGTTRRTVLKGAAAAGLYSTIPWGAGRARAMTGETEPDIDKWEDPLPIPGVVAPTSRSGGVDRYEITMDEFDQQVLSNSGDTEGTKTTVWGYNGAFPGLTIEARPGWEVEVEYTNNLPPSHLLSVDERVHGADSEYEVRTVTHLHGGVVAPVADGYPEAWVGVDPQDGTLVPNPNASVPYTQPKEYPNDQEPTTLWYHDHAIGITRLNVYAGLAAFYLLRDPMENSLPNGAYEVPIVFQDRSFKKGGDLLYPPGDEDDFEAEFWGDVPVVNGKTYPYLEVEPRSYRFRTLNGSNGRAFNMTLENEGGGSVPLMRQIATDQGFLDAPVSVGPAPGDDLPSLTLLGAERADLVVDFAGFEGQTFYVTNDAETPYAGENSGTDESISELLEIRVGTEVTEPDETVPPARFLKQIRKKYPRNDPPVANTRYMTLDTGTATVDGDELDSHFLNQSLWTDTDAIETVSLDTSEDWVLANTTGDAHPMHLHLVDFDVVKRQFFDAGDVEDPAEGTFNYERDQGNDPDVEMFLGDTSPVPANEEGPKDTVSVYPNEAVTIRPSFTDFTGRFVWHCHILEHEDQEMMLPYVVEGP